MKSHTIGLGKIEKGERMIRIFNENCLDLIGSQYFEDLTKGRKVCIVADPPFNVGYKYNEYKDNMEDDDYYSFLGDVLTTHGFPFVVIHYPEAIYKISFQTGLFPERVVSWVYNSNTARQHRDVAFFGIKPDFNLIRQPYKNPSDKRIAARIANGEEGSRLYDWWEVNQTKNVSKVRGGVTHPCVMPTEVMRRIVGILPTDCVIFDPFMGSGTTGIACRILGRDFIGCEIDETYFEEARKRLEEPMSEQMKLF